MPQYPGFCGETFVSQSRLASAARAVNLYPEIMQSETSRVKVVLYPTPGLLPLVRAGTGVVGRGLYATGGRCWAVFGPQFKEVLFDGTTFTLAQRGDMMTDANPATITTSGDTGKQLAVTSGNRLYILDLVTNTFSGPVDLTGATFVVFLNGRFVVLDAPHSKIMMSGPEPDGGLFDPTDYDQRADAPDPWRALAVSSNKELWLLGEHTGSIYYDDGTSTFPLVPRLGVLITPGILAPFSLKEVNGSMMWLAHGHEGGGSIVRAKGYDTEIVSTEPVKYAISQYVRRGRVNDAVAWTYEQQGHHFYVLNFPSANATWVFDDKTGWWHERGTYDGLSGDFVAWGPQYHAHEWGRNLVSDHRDGALYDMEIWHHADTNGKPLRRLRIAPGLVNELDTVYYDEFRLYLETGLGNNAGPGVNPQVALRLSNDGGRTWGSEWWRTAGRIGEFNPPYVQWDKLGSATDRIFQIHMSDPIPWRIVDAFLKIRSGGR